MKKSVVRATTTVLMTAMLSVSLCQPMLAAENSDTINRDDRSTAEAASTTTGSSSPNRFDFTPSTIHPYSSIQSKIKSAQQTNADVRGWIVIPGTNINEPVTYSRQDNSYYINRDWTGKNYPNNNWQNFVHTAVYADMRTKFASTWAGSSKNTVLYGHNWTNLRDPMDIGSNNNHIMFGQLPSYTSISFASENPYIYYSTGENEGIWKVFAVAYTEPTNKNFNFTSVSPSAEHMQFLIDEWQMRSMFTFDVDVTPSDRLLTLSTCTRAYASQVAEQRFVVVARLLREGESENEEVRIKVNENQKKPQF